MGFRKGAVYPFFAPYQNHTLGREPLIEELNPLAMAGHVSDVVSTNHVLLEEIIPQNNVVQKGLWSAS